MVKELKKRSGLVKWFPLLATAISVVIIIIDSTVLNVSVNEIKADLGISSQAFQWIVTCYSLVLAALTITGGRLGDMFGRKKMFVTGAILFGTGSLIASFATSQLQLILGWSVLEGIGAALMMPAGSALLVSNYQGADRAKAFGIYGGLAGISAALGPIFGGFVTEHFSWHWALRINIFVVILLILASRYIIEARDKAHANKLDFAGVGLSAIGLGILSYGFVQTSTYGWIKAKAIYHLGDTAIKLPFNVSIAFACMVVGAALFATFMWQQKRHKEAGKEPLIDLNLFKNRQYTSGAATMGMLALVQGGFVLVLPLFFGATRQYDAFHQGLAIVPYSIGFFIAAATSASLARKYSPKRIIQTGAGVSFMGYLAFALTISGASTAASVRLPLLVMGLGGGLMISLISNLTLSAVRPDQAGQASGVFSTFRNIGGTLGSAIVGAVLISSIISLVPKQAADVNAPASVKKAVAVSVQTSGSLNKNAVAEAIKADEELTDVQKQEAIAGYDKAIDDGYGGAAKRSMSIATGLVAISFIATMALPKKAVGTGHHDEKPVAAAH